ncbi:MAG: hypothetical protein H0U63_01110 [Burkholderiales bacterium]|nr:hypothetical protein [Burkholderiales bacterium]
MLVCMGGLISSMLNHRKLNKLQWSTDQAVKAAEHAVRNAKAAAQAAEHFRDKLPVEVTVVNTASEAVPIEDINGLPRS